MGGGLGIRQRLFAFPPWARKSDSSSQWPEPPSIPLPHSWLSCSLCSAQSLEFSPGTGMTNTGFHFHGDQGLHRTRTPCLKCPNSLTQFPLSDQNKGSRSGSCQRWGRSQSCCYLQGHSEEKQVMTTTEYSDDATEPGSEIRPNRFTPRAQRWHQTHSAPCPNLEGEVPDLSETCPSTSNPAPGMKVPELFPQLPLVPLSPLLDAGLLRPFRSSNSQRVAQSQDRCTCWSLCLELSL